MQAVPDPLSQLSLNAQALLDRLSRQFATALFDIEAAVELIEHGFATGFDSGLDITAAGLLNSQTSP